MKEEIKEYKEGFEEKLDNFGQASDKLNAGFLWTGINHEQVEDECFMKSTADLDKIKLKTKLEEDDFYDFPADPMELIVNTGKRHLLMNILENNVINARQ